MHLFRVTLLLLSAGILHAQSADAVLSGAVTDPAGAVVPNARITAVNQATGLEVQTRTNSTGVYLLGGLQPGAYRVAIEQQGFRKTVYDNVTLEVGGRLNLNVKLEVGAVAESVQITAEADNRLDYATSSVGGVITGQKVQDLPLPARNALGLVLTQAGMVGDNFAGGRTGALNITLDGLNIQDQRNHQGLWAPIFTSTDKVEEFRVITAPADAEFGRGSGQVQMITKSGGNQLHGSLFEYHRNTVLNANRWFNNQRGLDPRTGQMLSPRNDLIRNQFGGRISGPIRKNKTFFFFLYDAQRIAAKTAVTNTVYTESARRGIYRFFPGARNGNAESATATVDLLGNPRRPTAATGDLQSVSLYNRDPNRVASDPTGLVPRLFALTPLPNNFRTGDGLNTAGYTWRRPSTDNFDNFNFRIDHNFNAAHRVSYTYNREIEAEYNTRYEQPFPDSPGGNIERNDRFHSLAILSTLKPTVLNEFRAGVLRPDTRAFAPWETNPDFLPRANGQPFVPVFNLVADVVVSDDDPVRLFNPLYQFNDNITWIHGKHAFKGGIDVRFSSTNSFNSSNVMPRANFGVGGQPVLNLDAIAGIGQNLANANSMLTDLSGSLSNIVQALNAEGGANPQYMPGLYKYRHWKRPEVSWFFKDDWKLTPNVTLNLGVRWEYYGVPVEPNGRTTSMAGGTGAIFGISGTSWSDVYQPGRAAGSLSQVNLIGPGTKDPNTKLYNEDYNNFAPAIGVSWAVPWFGRKTVLRAGYGVFYERQSLRLVDVVSGDQPGLREQVNYATGSYLDLRGIKLPLSPTSTPLSTIPVTDRTQTVRVFDSNMRTPYIQNWNLSIQREIASNTVLEVRYVGSKGTKLLRGVDVNERNIFENGILEAFLITQAGGNAPLLNRIFQGINVSGLGVVDGVTRTGSDAIRTNTTTQAYLAGHNVATFAEYLNANTQYTNARGGLLRRAGLPENFVIANPQFTSARLTGNYANSIYHGLQIEVIRRFKSGWTYQGNYTWSRAIGEENGDGEALNLSYRSGRNRSLDRKVLGFNLKHAVRNSGTFELPFGPGKLFFGNSRGILARVLEHWQFGGIVNFFSGSPIDILSGRATFNSFNASNTTATPTGSAPKGLGGVTKVGNGVVFFQGLQQVPDPSVASLTTLNNIRGRSTLTAIADSSGKILFVNPTPGQVGGLAYNAFYGPSSNRIDLNIMKRIQLSERVRLELRADAINATNTPSFSAPAGDINSVNFGRITGTDSDPRIMVVSARINF